MARREIVILDAGSPPMKMLAMRLHRIGYRVLPAKTADHAERILHRQGSEIGAALIPVNLPTFDLRAALRFLRRLEPSGELTFVAAGRRPDAEGCALLREAGVELSIWEPVDANTLRFQINRALASSSIVRGHRGALRAPADFPIAVWANGRKKPARVYSLSCKGAYLATPRPSLPSSQLRLELPVPSQLEIAARVVMTNVPGNLIRGNLPIGMGVLFEDTSPDIEVTLETWASERLAAIGF